MTTTSQPSTTTVTATVPPARNEPTQIKSDVDEKVAKLSAKRDASWPSVLFYIHLNILGLYGIMVLFTNAYLTTVIFTVFLSFIGIIGVTCGAHRLWAHQTYEANTFLRLFLMLCQTMAGQVIDKHYYFVSKNREKKQFQYNFVPIFFFGRKCMDKSLGTTLLNHYIFHKKTIAFK